MRAAVKPLAATVVATILALGLSGCGTHVDPGTSDERASLHARAQGALSDFETTDPTLSSLVQSAHAYVIFPNVVTAAIVIGGGHGRGEAYQGGKVVGIADISQASVGAQLGGQGFSELILFQTAGAFADFTQGSNSFDARATAVAASNGAATSADYRRGVLVFVLPQGGLMAQAAIGGQSFRYTPLTP